jgi:carbonic anhydrase
MNTSQRSLFPGFALVLLFCACGTSQTDEKLRAESPATPAQAESVSGLQPDSVLQWLMTGNTQFSHGQFDAHGVDSSLRMHLSGGQHPKAVIITCSDSRVPPELVFDKGLGDLFVIRVAGNIIDDAVLGSVEYAVEHLHTPLIVVMGHKNCGAISAAVSDLQDPAKSGINNHIRALTDRIEQAVNTVNLDEKDMTRKALLSNVMFSVDLLRKSRPVLAEEVGKGDLRIEGAVYDVTSGKVEWLPSR